MDVSGINELLEPKDTEITLPKNRLEQIFDQYFLAKINEEDIYIIGEEDDEYDIIIREAKLAQQQQNKQQQEDQQK